MVRADKFVDKKGQKIVKQLTLYLDIKMYKELKILSAEKMLSMNDLGREGLEHVLNKYKKANKS
ncbi:hypothetical protein BEV13_01855 [Rickettsiella grylli]|uniref:hypothetical protein n=1 Tax=Rickettsiella grylli TaxID=59196 RepID=UPI0008FD28F0|nr:hypothetical protein [Rickettsiella grylli]OJA00916.1 hypothetical protein BEV13_01855 [Rickettsiella grylli]